MIVERGLVDRGNTARADELLGLEDPSARADSRDVLGVGTLRDAIADAFFPGVTTQQTRAKYFLFVPALYAQLESERVRDSHERMHQLEDELLQRLRAEAGKYGPEGIIGSRSWKVPLRPPSEIYWNGLRTWGIRQFRNPRSEYHRVLELGLLSATSRLSDDEPGATDVEQWRLPNDIGPLFTTGTLELSKPEAQFLRDRILAIKDRPHTSLLKYLVDARGG